MSGAEARSTATHPVSLEGLMRLMMDMQAEFGGISREVGSLRSDTNVNTMALQAATTKIAELVKAVGDESSSDDGTKKGTGLFGRVVRLENAKMVYDRWTNRAIGMAMAATVLISVVWWLINDKMEHVLKGGVS